MNDKILATIIERASEIWQVAAEGLSKDTEFASMNPKSAHYAQMTTYLEDAFDVEVPFMKFKRCETFGEAAEFVLDLVEE